MSRSTFLLIGSSVLALACTEYEIQDSKDAQGDLTDGGAPDITVDPTAIDFGSITVSGDGSTAEVTEVVTILNEGDADLNLSDLYLSDETGPYTIGSVSSVLLQPGGTAQFTVTFSPASNGDLDGVVYIDSNDPDEPTVEVALSGRGVAPQIEVLPTEYDFGSLYIGCDGLQPITISNVGSADLVVSNLNYTTGTVDLDFDAAEDVNGPLPWTLSPGATAEVYVAYTPYDEFPDSAYLFVDSNDPYQPQVIATQQGVGELYGSNTDVYEQPIKGMSDIIFAVDKSCSMYDDIANVQTNFGAFVTTMSGLDADFHVAATVEDNGCINGSDLYIDNTFTSSQAQATITTMINMSGSYASNTERAFMLLESCLSESIGSGGCNSGLVREDATLNLVGVSDEPEQSVNNYTYYVSAFQALKADPDDVVFHAIGGDMPSGCGGNSPYTGYYEATVATGGLFLSICATDWGAHLEALAEGSTADLSSFALTQFPVPETITVRVDGITTTVGWEYVAATNTIEFESDYVPEGGSTIEVDYALFGDCDE